MLLIIFMFLSMLMVIGLLIYGLNIMGNKDIKKAGHSFVNLIGLFIAFIITFILVTAIVYIASVEEHNFYTVMTIFGYVISAYLMFKVAVNSLKLASNLENGKIFENTNTTYIKKIANLFIILGVFQASLDVFIFLVYSLQMIPIVDGVKFEISIYTIFNGIVGILFFVIYLIYKEAVRIHEENQLTI